MRKLSLLFFLALLVASPAAFAQAPCTSALSANGPVFNAQLLPTSVPNSFAAVSLNLNGSNATINASTLGLDAINGLTITNGQTAMAFTDQTNGFQNGHFTRTLAIDPTLAAQIAANPSSFMVVLDTSRGVITAPLSTSTGPVLSGMLNGSGMTGTFLFTFGTPTANGEVPLNFDIVTNGAGNDLSSLQLVTPNGERFFDLGTNLTATSNGRFVGTAMINTPIQQLLLSNPCGVLLAVKTPAGLAVSGALAAGQEVFIPVAGSTSGLLGNNWKTDLSVFNGGTASGGTSALVQFIPTGASLASAQSATTLSLPPRGMAATRDITNAMFNGINGIGAMRIISSGTVFANARIYDDQTANGKGTLGQSVPGLMRSQAVREGALVGLTSVHSGLAGANAIGAQNARTNIGFFNPNDTPTTVAVEMRGAAGDVVGTQIINIGPFTHTQMALAGANGLFTSETSDFTGRSVTFLAGAPIFAYASIVDNDSGDASFILPSSFQ